MALRTPLYQAHVDCGAKMVDFHGWDMPVHYGSQLEEHHSVRQHAGMFDVAHMAAMDLWGEAALPFLRRVLANDAAKLKAPGKGLYSCLLQPDGGIIDDVILYRLDDRWRLVVNAGGRDVDLAWLQEQAASTDVRIERRDDLGILAVQGPQARVLVQQTLPALCADAALSLPRFGCLRMGESMVARTGYTGEDGFELVIPVAQLRRAWDALRAAGVAPCGLGARDTLRLEAGLCLYGEDMDRSTTPLESNLAWTVSFEDGSRDFIGRQALEAQWAAGVARRLTGILLLGKGVLRHGYTVHAEGKELGVITSGTVCPTVGRSLGLVRVATKCPERVTVRIRDRELKARLVDVPFVRTGQVLVPAATLAEISA